MIWHYYKVDRGPRTPRQQTHFFPGRAIIGNGARAPSRLTYCGLDIFAPGDDGLTANRMAVSCGACKSKLSVVGY